MTKISHSNPIVQLSRRQVLAGAGAAGIAASFGTPAFAQQKQQAIVAYGSTGYTWALPFVAEDAGYWKAENVEISTKTFESGRDAMQALLTGAADFSTSADTPFVFAALSGLRPIAVANYSRYSREMKVAVRSDVGIDPKTPSSIKGKKIATRLGTSGQYMLGRYLELAGLTPKDITIVDLAPGNLATALTRGDIDGFAWTSQTVNVARRQSEGKVAEMSLDGIEKFFQSHQLLLTTEKVLKEKPQLINAGVKALFQAENRIQTDKDWPKIIADRIKTSPEQIAEAASLFTFQIGFDERFIDDLVSQAEWAIGVGLSKRPSGDLRALLRGLVVDGPVKSFKPDRVTLA